MPTYANILLPLPFNVAFTYMVPESLHDAIAVGHRVIVPFGAKKYYTGIVNQLNVKEPEGFEVKSITMLLDKDPILRFPQLKFWEWIANYYLSPLGDVYKAAVPAGLKIESESDISINPDAEDDELMALPEKDKFIVALLRNEGHMTAKEIEKKTGFRNVESIVSRLIDSGIVIITEKLVERYRTKLQTFVRVNLDKSNLAEDVKRAFSAIGNAKKQQIAFMTLMQISGFNRPDSEQVEVTKSLLQEKAGVASSIIKSLADKGLVEVYQKSISRFKPLERALSDLPALSAAQNTALDEIHKSFITHNISLLHGVTSSGKTEIYIHLIDYVMRQGRQVLYLVPEIALTTQLTRRLQNVFGNKVVIYHSRFSDNDRVEVWRRLLHSSEPCVVIGARSSIFLPFAHIGLVIVDEEHEASYKQYDPAPRYNARDAAIVLASMHGAKTLLGSATPAIETYYKATSGKFGLIKLTERYGKDTALPKIEAVDMTLERKRLNVKGAFSLPLVASAKSELNEGNQVIFFHNRRGFSPFARCKACAFVKKCDNCDVSLTYHKATRQLVCHYCGASYPLPTVCPVCHLPQMEVVGYGTERVEDEVEAMFPGHRILRMDLDSTRAKDAYENIIDDFSAHKADILVGTQMVTKGLDFGDVSLVGILNADQIINFPDFRSSERAFNMLSQVAGRAGRRNAEGKVVIQTYSPDNPIINFVKRQDYEGFFAHEIAERQAFLYPPFTRIIYIYLRHKNQDILSDIAVRYADSLRKVFGNRISGPEEPAISRIQQLYIRKIMLKVETEASMKKVKDILLEANAEMAALSQFKGTIIHYDVDPY